MNYSQWQKRNTTLFNSLNAPVKKQARELGYYNVGWDRVKKSWDILRSLGEENNKIISLFDAKLKRDDLIGALDLSIHSAEQAINFAKEAKKKIIKNQKEMSKLAKKQLEKYPLL